MWLEFVVSQVEPAYRGVIVNGDAPYVPKICLLLMAKKRVRILVIGWRLSGFEIRYHCRLLPFSWNVTTKPRVTESIQKPYEPIFWKISEVGCRDPSEPGALRGLMTSRVQVVQAW